MSDKKNIDRLFQEQFKDFEQVPNEAVWERINDSLHPQKKKRRIIPIWWQIGGVAAVIALLLTVGVSVFDSESNPTNAPVVNTEQNNSDNKPENSSSNPDSKTFEKKGDNKKNGGLVGSKNSKGIKDDVDRNSSQKDKNLSEQLTAPKVKSSEVNSSIAQNNNTSDQSDNTLSAKKQKALIEDSVNVNKSVVDNSSSETSEDKNLFDKDKLKSEMEKSKKTNKKALAENLKTENQNGKKVTNKAELKNKKDKSEELLKSSDKKQSIEDAIASNEPNNEKEEKERSRWSIAPNVAPVYFSSLGEGSSLDNQFNSNSKGGDINMSYGVKGSYAVSERLKVRAGINRVDLNQKTSDVFAFTGAATASRGVDAQFSNIKFRNGTQTVTMMSSRIMSNATTPEVFNTKSTGNIDQRFGFIEVPLELEYRLLDKKFGVNVIGGFSTFFLNNNEIYADVDGTSTLIGEANNINTTSFSANFGLGMDYNLSKQWNINLEPTFKYQINTFNNTTGNYRPFFIGVYTGLSFKF